jgi:hypothetical protein
METRRLSVRMDEPAGPVGPGRFRSRHFTISPISARFCAAFSRVPKRAKCARGCGFVRRLYSERRCKREKKLTPNLMKQKGE